MDRDFYQRIFKLCADKVEEAGASPSLRLRVLSGKMGFALAWALLPDGVLRGLRKAATAEARAKNPALSERLDRLNC
jgi:hypothetical protein